MADQILSNWHHAGRRGFVVIALLTLLAALCGCQVEEELELHADGSGSHRVKVSVPTQFAEGLQELKQKAIGEHYRVLQEGEAGDSKFLVMARDFVNVSDLNDKDDTFALSIDAASTFRRRYRLAVTFKSNAAAMNFKRVLRVRMPAAVDESTAAKITSDTVEWDCARGGQLQIAASGFAMPTPAALLSAVDHWFTRDRLLFVRDGELWTAAPDGSDAKRSNINGVGSVSVAPSGAITYDRFAVAHNQAQDLNIYLLKDGIDSRPRQLTSDGESIQPKFSPDGRSIVYQKFAWSGHAMKGRGKGLWLYDLATGDEHELVGADLPASPGNPLGLRNWRLDWVTWGADGRSLVLTREYQTNGGGIYSVDYVVSVGDGNTLPFDKYQSDGSYRAPLLAFDAGHVLANAWHGSGDGIVEEDTGTRQVRMIVPGVMAFSPALAPDGSTIAFATRADPKGSDLWTVHRDGSGLHRLTDRPLVDHVFAPQWAHDGRSLVVTVSLESGVRVPVGGVVPLADIKVVRIDASNGHQEIVAKGARSGVFAQAPGLSPVGLWLVKGALLLVVAILATVLVLALRRLGGRLGSRHRMPQAVPALAAPSRYCRSCGQALPATGAFCVSCGTRFE